MNSLLDSVYTLMNKGSLRALSLVMAIILTGCIFWQPARFATQTSNVEIWQICVLMWAVCSSFIYGLSYRPIKRLWQWFFIPLPAVVIVACGLVYFFN